MYYIYTDAIQIDVVIDRKYKYTYILFKFILNYIKLKMYICIYIVATMLIIYSLTNRYVFKMYIKIVLI